MRALLLRKAFRDLHASPGRVATVILAVALGVAGVGAALDAYAALDVGIARNYAETNPASAALHLAKPYEEIPSEGLGPDVAAAEPRREIAARFLASEGHWRSMFIFILDDPEHVRVDRVWPDQGQWPPHDGEIVIERSSFPIIDAKVGDNVTISTPAGRHAELRLVGSSHAPGMPPGWRAGVVYGYTTMATLERLGEAPGFSEIRLVVSTDATNATHIQAVATKTESSLERGGLEVARASIPAEIAGGRSGPSPGEHPSTGGMRVLLTVIGFFGAVSLILSALLVVTLFSALMAEQARQLAILKSIGASGAQMLATYALVVAGIGAIALVLGIPLGSLAGLGFAEFGLRVFNLDRQTPGVPPWALLVQVAVGLVLPLLAAAPSVMRAIRRPAREGLVDHGIDPADFGRSAIDRTLTRAGGRHRPAALSLRNAIRRKRRLALTLAALCVAGALFMSAQHTMVSWERTIDQAFEARAYDLDMRFTGPYAEGKIRDAIAHQPGIGRIEIWKHARGSLVLPDGRLAETMWVSSPPLPTKVVSFDVLEGRWLEPSDTHALVLTPASKKYLPGVEVGSIVQLEIREARTNWTVVGLVKELAGPTSAYAARAGIDEGVPYASLGARILASDRTEAGITELAGNLEKAASEEGVTVSGMTRTTELRESLDNHVKIVLFLLFLVAGVVALVGGLGLAAVMSVAVIERRREYGILRALGATSHDVRGLVALEGALVAAASWILAVPLSIPAAAIISSASGRVFLQYPLDMRISPIAIGSWLVLALVVGIVASLSAVKPLLRESLPRSLSYE